VPGKKIIQWIYKKHHGQREAPGLMIEIDYIRIVGTKFSATECISCKAGFSNPGSDRCDFCPGNFYFDPNSDLDLCKPCEI